MAEYYPLLAKAVAGLNEPTREARQALYDRARNALLNQLRNLQPPVGESEIARETEALASAAAKLESELNARSAPPPDPSAFERTLPPRTPGKFTAPSSFPTSPPKPPISQPGSPPGSSLASPPGAPPRGVAPEPPPQAPPIPSAKKSAGEPPPGPDLRGRASTAFPVFAGGDEKTQSLREGPPTAMAMPSLKLRPEASRPYAPQPLEEERQPQARRLWIVGAVLAVFVALIAVAAWKLRDRPEDINKAKLPQQTQTEATSAKISDRIGPKKSDAATTTAATTPDVARTRSEETAPPLPVAQRAALLLEAPEEANKVKTFVGTVVWRLDNVSNGSGQPLGTAVRADIDIPEAKLKVAMIFQKNFDASLSASHTMTVVFTPSQDSPVGMVKEIKVPQMRALEAQTTDPLGGIPVPIMENSFLIGLSRGAVETQNIELIRQRDWVDIPMVLQSGRAAKLTFEKNATGTRAIEDAIAVWKAQ